MPPTSSTDAAADRGTATSAAAATTREPEFDRLIERRRKREPGFALDCGTGPDVRHVGIVFVHGIGSQQPGETLLHWGGAIIGLLLDVRVAQQASGDPVIACQLDPGPFESRYIELQLPAATSADGTAIPEQHWVMTEAWWAQRVRPPAFGQMAEWLGPRGAIRRILLAILPRGRGEHDPRLRPCADTYPLRRDEHGVEESAEHGNVVGQEGRTDTAAQAALRSVGRVSAGLYLQAISALILVVYGALRSIEKLVPIGPLRDGALTRPIDRFVLDWFGDVFVLLSEPAQAASVRGRLVDALEDLHAAKCDSVVVVAHSGGAIVSYMTLADRANRHLRVDRLITLGEGLNLAWLLSGGEDGVPDETVRRRYERLYSDVFDGRPTLSWHDFWASQDPAPVGVLKFPAIHQSEADDRATLGRIRSHAVWNRLSFGDDHGTYWQNDEEFLLPMLRLLDGGAGTSRFLSTDDEDRARSNRRRRRLSILSLWRQLSLVAPTAAVVAAFAAGSAFVHRASDAVASAWSAIPGSDIVSEPLDALRGLDIAGTPPGVVLAEAGVWVVAALIGLLTVFALIAPPERPVPWAVGRLPWLSGLLRLLPWAVGLPIFAAVVFEAVQFIGGATGQGAEVGRLVGSIVAAVVALAILVVALFGSPGVDRGWATVREIAELPFTILVMTLAVFLALSPVVSMIAFEDVGRTVLGSLAILAAFQVMGRIGAWRWNVWDGRERVAARTGRAYPRLRRVLVQCALLVAIVVVLFLAVVLDSDVLVVAAAAGTGVAVLLGISVDVFDAARQERTTPTDTLLRAAQMKGA
jgi:hypothetical protein